MTICAVLFKTTIRGAICKTCEELTVRVTEELKEVPPTTAEAESCRMRIRRVTGKERLYGPRRLNEGGRNFVPRRVLLSLSFVNIARREVCSLHTPWHWRWLVFAVFVGAHSFNWHAVATMATWFMTLLIQRAEHRDTQAIQAELDELLHAQAKARNHLTHIDEFEAEDLERHRKEARTND